MREPSMLIKINTKDIKHDKYQRPLDMALVRKIVSHWNDNLKNLPKVSFRDGNYYVFDGQHTIEALKLRNDGKDVDVVCRVYSGLTYEDEARLFAAQNGIHKGVSTAQKMKALYEAKDPDVIAVADVVMEYGYPNPVASDYGGKVFRTLPAALKIYEKFGMNRLRDVLSIITEAWGNAKDGCKSGMLYGVNVLLNTYPGEFTKAELAKSLQRVSPVKINADAKADIAHSGANRYAFQMVRIYNKKRTYRLDEREIR